MNKKLLALAVAGACVAPSVMAQSANPVTLYGRAYVMLESVEAKGGPAGTTSASRTRVSDQSSLIGVRGKEDVGGGLKVFFQLETAFSPDSGAGNTYATRNSGVGLEGGFGTLMIGRWDSPYKIVGYGPDIFGDLTIGGITSAMHDRGNFDARLPNNVQYWTPKMGGFTARLALMVNEDKTATLDPQTISANLVYSNKMMTLQYGYEKKEDQGGFAKQEGNEVAGEFTFGNLKASAMYEEIKKSNLSTQKNVLASLLYTMGKHQVAYQFQNSKDGAAKTAATQPECDVNTVAYFYNWSKRSQFVGLYTKVDNNAAGVCRFGTGALGTLGNGNDQEGFAVGIKHVF